MCVNMCMCVCVYVGVVLSLMYELYGFKELCLWIVHQCQRNKCNYAYVGAKH